MLDRIEIPDEARREISAQLTPGSSLIIAETSVNSALLREGDDFIVWTKDAPPVAAASPETRQAKAKKANRAKALLAWTIEGAGAAANHQAPRGAAGVWLLWVPAVVEATW